MPSRRSRLGPRHPLADGLLRAGQQVVDGRRRRVYLATEAGRAVLAEDRAALAELAREILGDGESPGDVTPR